MMGVFLVRLYRGVGLCRKEEECPNSRSPSVPGERKRVAVVVVVGLSVLEESHVVSESGQLLLIWNQ